MVTFHVFGFTKHVCRNVVPCDRLTKIASADMWTSHTTHDVLRFLNKDNINRLRVTQTECIHNLQHDTHLKVCLINTWRLIRVIDWKLIWFITVQCYFLLNVCETLNKSCTTWLVVPGIFTEFEFKLKHHMFKTTLYSQTVSVVSLGIWFSFAVARYLFSHQPFTISRHNKWSQKRNNPKYAHKKWK